MTELEKLWAEHQDADAEQIPVSKVVDVYWNVGYILGPTYSKKLEEELEEEHGLWLMIISGLRS